MPLHVLVWYYTRMTQNLQQYLDSLQRDQSLVVDAVLKENNYSKTEKVHFAGGGNGTTASNDGSNNSAAFDNGAGFGSETQPLPLVRKTFRAGKGVGNAWQRLFQAQQNGARFAHLPHLIDCYEAGEDCVVLMECIEGQTFEELVQARGASVSLARSLFPGACDAVSELHTGFSPALIHRDVKPSNLMFSHNAVVLIDLGIARSFNEEASTDTTNFGTRGFAPPEQFGFGQTDERSDVYALGMLLFYLLVGEIPAFSKIDQLMEGHAVPQEMQQVIRGAIAFDPAARFQSAEALKRAFESALKSAPEAVSQSVPKFPSQSTPESAPESAPKNTSQSTSEAASQSTPQNFFKGAPQSTSESTPPNEIRPLFKQPLLSKAMFWLGVVWDVILFTMVGVMLAGSIYTALNPVEPFTDFPLLPRFIVYMCIWIFVFSPVVLLFAPRPLARIMPRFKTWRFTKRLKIVLTMLPVTFVIYSVVYIIYGL